MRDVKTGSWTIRYHDETDVVEFIGPSGQVLSLARLEPWYECRSTLQSLPAYVRRKFFDG
jgi:hypothetical protein